MQELTDELDAISGYHRVVGESQQWREVLKKVTQVAGTGSDSRLAG
jgi:hypothetical protein